MDGLKFIKKVSSILTKNPPICLCLPTLVAKHFEAIIYIYNSALFLDRGKSKVFFIFYFNLFR